MRIAYLLLCHTDAPLLQRVIRRLTGDGAQAQAFVHIDAKSGERAALEASLSRCDHTHQVASPVDVWWGGSGSIEATWRLMELALLHGPFDRYVFLQGLVYPIKTNEHIAAFFAAHPTTEFLRAINLTRAPGRIGHWRFDRYHFMDRPNIAKRVVNRLSKTVLPPCRPSTCDVGREIWDFHWGNAEWAVTEPFVRHALTWRHDERLHARFAHVYAPDEMLLHTILHNSPFGRKTLARGSETDHRLTVTQLKNLVYTEYPGSIRVFEASAFPALLERPELFVRKVRTAPSTPLLDALDREHGG